MSDAMDNPRDTNFATAHSSEEPSEGGASFAAQLAGGGDDGYVIETEKKQKIGGSTLAFVGLAVAAGAGLWLMKSRTGGPAAAAAATNPQTTAARASIQEFLAGGSSEVQEMKDLLADTEAIKDRFERVSQDRQIPLDSLKTNPFWHEAVDEETEDAAAILSRQQEEKLREEKERLRREAQEKAGAEAALLNLETVFLGSRPTCLINGRICRVGSTIDGFHVVSIRHGEVDIRREAFEFTLKLSN